MDQFLGQLMLFAGDFAPRGWALCNGQLMQISTNQALFSILSTTYGGDGITTFALPDLRGRAASHEGTGTGLTAVKLGQKYGSESNSLTALQMPEHVHTVANTTVNIAASTTNDEDTDVPTDAYIRATPGMNSYSNTTDGTMGASTLTATATPTGTGFPVNNIQPSLSLIYCIATVGIYPSRA